MGSVKDLLLIESPCENRAGLGNFVFSDRYSVFDWGEMPDHIPNKGRSLAAMAAFNFEELERQGVRTHYQGMVDTNGRLLRFEQLKQGGSSIMQVSLGRVYTPVAREMWRQEGVELSYDYSFFESNRGRLNNYLVGLEVIFRNGLPLGSSLFKRIEALSALGDARERARQRRRLLGELGLKAEPAPGALLPRPLPAGGAALCSGIALAIPLLGLLVRLARNPTALAPPAVEPTCIAAFPGVHAPHA